MSRVETKKEMKTIRDQLKSKDFKDNDLLRLCISETYDEEELQKALYDSLVGGVSYDRLSGRYYIPLNRNSFYEYQKRCLVRFRMYKENEVVSWHQMDIFDYLT